MSEVDTTKVAPELAVLVPVAEVCQYHVSPEGAVPLAVIVTLLQLGEFDVGIPGVAGAGAITTHSSTKSPDPLKASTTKYTV